MLCNKVFKYKGCYLLVYLSLSLIMPRGQFSHRSHLYLKQLMLFGVSYFSHKLLYLFTKAMRILLFNKVTAEKLQFLHVFLRELSYQQSGLIAR